MAIRTPAAGRFEKKIKLRGMWPLAAVMAGAVLMAAFGLYWVTTRSDTISVERQSREAHTAIDNTIAQLAQSLKGVAIWDESVTQLRRLNVNLPWIDENMGWWLHALFDHHHFYIVDAGDRPIYAMVDGMRVERERYEAVRAMARDLLDEVRGRLPATHPTGIEIATKTGTAPLSASGLVNVFDRPAAMAVMRNVPLTEAVPMMPGEEPLMISIRFLDGAFLQELSRRNLIEAPRFATRADLAEGESAVPLTSTQGQPVGFIIWRPELPGTAVLKTLAPILALAICAMIVIVTVLVRWLFRSVGELRASETQAQHLASHDPLTGLPNRATINHRIDQALAEGQAAAVFILDLDRFKQINDTLGHAAGDALIRQFAGRLSDVVRGTDTVARIGGDEFVILCLDLESWRGVEGLSQRVLDVVRQPFDLFGNQAFVGVSLGVSCAPADGTDRAELLRKADIALYRAKAEGRDCFRPFTPAMDEVVKLRSTIEDDLRAALASRDGLVLHYQPQVSCRDQAVLGLEALVRWQHAERGLIPPNQFIPVAEETGLIAELGEWVLRRACEASLQWPHLFMAVNLSPVQFMAPAFAQRVEEIVRETGANPRQIELEVTESVLLNNDASVAEALHALRAAGFRVALDDFGTGYSSLGYLRRFRVDKIKLDRSFIQPLGESEEAAAIVTAVLNLGRAMGLAVTAEGVETEAQQRFLTATGCTMMQGYLFSRPVPGEDVAGMVLRAQKQRGAA
jgi:diguanylate cyclase (GGDEF)-like protein